MTDAIVVGLWGLVAGSGLLVGAVAAEMFSKKLRHRTIAAVMGFGAGVQLAVVVGSLVGDAIRLDTGLWAITALLAGAAMFSGINWYLARAGAKNRKRCGGCVAQPTEEQHRGSGTAIAVGSVLDGIPEALVIGLSVMAGGALGVGVIAGFFLANVPQGLSSAAGMKAAGRSRRYIFAIWTGIPLLIGASAASGNLILGAAAAEAPVILAFAAGAVLAMLTETVIPEAADDAPPFIGFIAVGGFLASLLLVQQ
ncbi:ZIP family zinc transporter [Sphingomonas suaedae]|uniref:ZIP family zinc transporter n=1 Tax=Sphingomonas suaedae TaxID=2599297 RepID=A0A518RHL4_9SPHN|nr:ZIP family zinc transporter [Sphingomonas suaedae]QDX26924.1 ZIP family zinc transporter [Sphingomonas suaedae]